MDAADRWNQHGPCGASVVAWPSHHGDRLDYFCTGSGGRCHRSREEQPKCASDRGAPLAVSGAARRIENHYGRVTDKSLGHAAVPTAHLTLRHGDLQTFDG